MSKTTTEISLLNQSRMIRVPANMSEQKGGFANLTSSAIVVFDVIECLIGVMGSMTNMMVLLAIYKERSLRTITNCFVGSLAASDVLVGVVVPPFVVISNWGLKINFTACILINSPVVLLTNISVLNLLSVAIDRFAAIRKPFVYHRWMTIHRALYLVVVTWLAATIIGLLPVMGWNNGQDEYTICTFRAVVSLNYLVYFIFFTVTLPPLIAMTSIYFYIFSVVRKARKRQNQLLTTVIQKDELKSVFKKNTRGDKGILMVILLFILCWMPLHITNILLRFSDLGIPAEFYQLCNVLSRLNSFINPFLFAFGYSRFKIAIKKLLFKRCLTIEPDDSAVLNRRIKNISKRTEPNIATGFVSTPSPASTSNLHAILNTYNETTPTQSFQRIQQLQYLPTQKGSTVSGLPQTSVYDILSMMSDDFIAESSTAMAASTFINDDTSKKTYSIFSNEFLNNKDSLGSLCTVQESEEFDTKSTFV